MTSFDIGTLLNFNPPIALCLKCKALWFKSTSSERISRCPVCGVIYRPGDTYSYWQPYKFLTNEGHGIAFENPVAHGQRLAAIAYNFNKRSIDYPPMRAILESISAARQFVHFTTFGLSHALFGALKLKAQTTTIRGIAANLHSDFAREISDYRNEAPRLELKVYERNNTGNDSGNIPHQKLIVIDGLLAFKGAANMTNEGLRKAAVGRDHIEVVTNIEEVVTLHNKLFSPIWSESSDQKTIVMDDIPF
jgi:phosphatidylserine/phosphatidylglycerophosphate/cardiolipin synthase-like enzyme